MSIFSQCLTGVAAELATLGLSNVEEIAVRLYPTDNGQHFPGITVHPIQEGTWRGTNEQEDIGYGVGITMAINNDMDIHGNIDTIYAWREAIRRYFVENQTVSSLPTLYQVKVEHRDNQDDDTFRRDNMLVSRLVIRCWSRETRT